jgi:PAS domain S-box-containing protein
MAEKQANLENIISHIPGSVYWMDKNLVCLGCNNNMAKLVGLNSREDIIGLTHADIEHISLWKNGDLEVINSGKSFLSVEELPAKKYYLINRAPIFDNNSNITGVICILVDISEHKKIEQLENDKAIADKTSKLMQKLAGSIAHEVRTPLSIININVNLLEKMLQPAVSVVASEENSIKDKYIKIIKYAVKLASRIIDDILVMIRTVSGGKITKTEFQYLSMVESINDVLHIYPFLDHEKELINLDVANNFIYYGDPILMQHVLFNLIKNALFSIKDAGKGSITIKLEPGKSGNKLIFTDTALGIVADSIPKIFDLFETKKEGGFGLGLAFCKMVMQLYGGSISCVSKLGAYAQFVLTFPCVGKKTKAEVA